MTLELLSAPGGGKDNCVKNKICKAKAASAVSPVEHQTAVPDNKHMTNVT
jgi:hypothetical protein